MLRRRPPSQRRSCRPATGAPARKGRGSASSSRVPAHHPWAWSQSPATLQLSPPSSHSRRRTSRSSRRRRGNGSPPVQMLIPPRLPTVVTFAPCCHSTMEMKVLFAQCQSDRVSRRQFLQAAGAAGFAAVAARFGLGEGYAFAAGPGGTSSLGSGTVPEQIHLTWGADPVHRRHHLVGFAQRRGHASGDAQPGRRAARRSSTPPSSPTPTA